MTLTKCETIVVMARVISVLSTQLEESKARLREAEERARIWRDKASSLLAGQAEPRGG